MPRESGCKVLPHRREEKQRALIRNVVWQEVIDEEDLIRERARQKAQPHPPASPRGPGSGDSPKKQLQQSGQPSANSKQASTKAVSQQQQQSTRITNPGSTTPSPTHLAAQPAGIHTRPQRICIEPEREYDSDELSPEAHERTPFDDLTRDFLLRVAREIESGRADREKQKEICEQVAQKAVDLFCEDLERSWPLLNREGGS